MVFVEAASGSALGLTLGIRISCLSGTLLCCPTCYHWKGEGEVLTMRYLFLAVMVQSVCRLSSLVLGPLVSRVEEQLSHVLTTTKYLKQEEAHLKELSTENSVLPVL